MKESGLRAVKPVRMSNFAVVTATSAEYFYFAQGLILSLKERPETADIPICVFDLGLNDEQLRWLADVVQHVRKVEWECDFPGRDELPEHFKNLVARPHIPRYFPEYEIVMWMDADTWVQRPETLDLFRRGASNKGFAVVPEVHPCYAGCLNRSSALRELAYKSYETAFGAEVASKYQSNAIINTGVWAMHRDSPLRPLWIENLKNALQRTHYFMVEEMSFNYALYDNLDKFFPEYVQLLPATCNWMCHQALPMFDEASGLFVAPNLPHDPINVVHRTSDELKGRGKVTLRTVQGNTHASSLEYRNGEYSRQKIAFAGWQAKDSDWAARG